MRVFFILIFVAHSSLSMEKEIFQGGLTRYPHGLVKIRPPLPDPGSETPSLLKKEKQKNIGKFFEEPQEPKESFSKNKCNINSPNMGITDNCLLSALEAIPNQNQMSQKETHVSQVYKELAKILRTHSSSEVIHCDPDFSVKLMKKLITSEPSKIREGYVYPQEELLSLVPEGERKFDISKLCDCQFYSEEHEKIIVLYPKHNEVKSGAVKKLKFGLEYNINTDAASVKAALFVNFKGKPNTEELARQLRQEVALNNHFYGKVGIGDKMRLVHIGKAEKDHQYVIHMEPYEQGTLADYIKEELPSTEADQQNIKKDPDNEELPRMLFELLSGLNELHNEDIVHSDIKPQNILVKIDKDGKRHLILSDLGLANKKTNIKKGIQGTFLYFPPEIADNVNTTKSDMWALGLVSWQIKTHQEYHPVPKFSHSIPSSAKIIPKDFNYYGYTVKLMQINSWHEVDNLVGSNCEMVINKKVDTLEDQIDSMICNMLNPKPDERIDAHSALKTITNICNKLPKRCK